MELRLLGPVEIWQDGRMLGAGPRQRRHVLAALAVEAGKLVLPETLVDRVWDEAPAGARHTLHVHLSRIRQLLSHGPDTEVRLISRSGGYVLDIDPGQVDVHQFRRLLAESRAGRRSTNERSDLLGRALSLWRGEPLASLPGQWAARTRQAWQQQYLEAVVSWSRDQIALDDPATAIDLLTDAANQHPFVEPLAAVLMKALTAAGRQSEALDHYANVRRQLAEKLGIDPGSELQAAYQAILRGQPPAAAPPAVGGVPTVVRQPEAPAQLPADLPTFSGRSRELAELDTVLAEPRTAAAIVTLSGTAGVGKTALAVHWAHRVRRRFPDGQLYVNLRGFDPSGAALTPAEAICGFLNALGVPPRRIPNTIDAQAGLYRTLVADRRILVILDNVRDAEQVRPLLPGSATALTLVTSRRRLVALTVAEGAHPLPLELLTPTEARALLAQRLGAARLDPDPRATEQIITACARLPLALAIVAARAVHTGFPLAALAAELGEAGDRLDALDADDAAVRAVFSWSYTALTTPAARLFRLLGLPPGPDIDAPAAASLVGQPLRRVGGWLAELASANLLVEHAPGRYTIHDLLRVYAAEVAHDTDSEPARQAALEQLMDHYLGAATAVAGHLAPRSQAPTVVPDRPAPAAVSAVGNREQAIEWFSREQPNLVAAVGWAATHDLTRVAVGLPAALHAHLRSRGPWTLALDLHHTALIAARNAADHPGQARTLTNLADVQRLSADFPAAAVTLGQAFELYGRLGDLPGQANVLHDLGIIHRLGGDFPAAASQLGQSLESFQRLGDLLGQANVLHSLANVQRLRGDYRAAVASLRQALELYRRFGDLPGLANALNTLANVQRLTGDSRTAVHTAEQSLELYRRLGDRLGEANASHSLGLVRHATGDFVAAAGTARRALGLYRELGDRLGEANALHSLGLVRHATGDFVAAAATARRALGLYRQLGARLGEANALRSLGLARHASGDHDAAVASLGQALDIFRAVEDPEGEAEVRNDLGLLLLAAATPTATPTAAREQFAVALAIARRIDMPLHEARALEGLGDCALRAGDRAEGLGYLRQAVDICQRIDSPPAAWVQTALR